MNKLIVQVCFLFSIMLATTNSFSADKNELNNQYRDVVANFYHLQPSKHLTMLTVKGYQQTTEYTCGPASIMSLLHFYGMLNDKQLNSVTELNIAKEMGTSEEIGTSPQQMVTWLERHGFTVKSGENGTVEMLQSYLKQGIPVIVEWVDWGGHWVVTTGYHVGGKNKEEDKDTILFADPSVSADNVKYMNGISVFNPDRFAAMWFDAQYVRSGQVVKGIYIIATPKKSLPTKKN